MNHFLVIEEFLEIVKSLNVLLVLTGLIFIASAIIGKFKDWFDISSQPKARIFAGISGLFFLVLGILMNPDTSFFKTTPETRSTLPTDRYYAHLYWHESGFTENDTRRLKSLLEKKNVEGDIKKHSIAEAPDAVFIGALIPSEIATLILEEIPYKARYIYRPDYPKKYGGDPSGFFVGIGYSSLYNPDPKDPTSIPVEILQDTLNFLSEPDITNTEFQKRLRAITSF